MILSFDYGLYCSSNYGLIVWERNKKRGREILGEGF